jgi:hypothetical protein
MHWAALTRMGEALCWQQAALVSLPPHAGPTSCAQSFLPLNIMISCLSHLFISRSSSLLPRRDTTHMEVRTRKEFPVSSNLVFRKPYTSFTRWVSAPWTVVASLLTCYVDLSVQSICAALLSTVWHTPASNTHPIDA